MFIMKLRCIHHLRKENPLDKILINESNTKTCKEINEYLYIVQWNCRKMKHKDKQARIKANIQKNNPDIIVLQETNLKGKNETPKKKNKDKNPTENEEFEVPGYEIKIKDGKTGLLIGIKKNIDFEEIEDNSINFGRNMEFQIYKIHLKQKSLTIINLYRNCTAEANAAFDSRIW